MKRRLYIVVFMLVLAGAARAQRSGNGLSIVNLTAQVVDQSLEFDFDIRATGVDVSDCEGQLILEFAVEAADRRVVLPAVVYSSAVRSRFEERRRLLSDRYSVEPYHVYEGVRRDHAYLLDYQLSVSYQAWMAGATLTYRQYIHDCSGERLMDAGVLTDNFGVGSPQMLYGSDPAPAYAYTPAPTPTPTPVPEPASEPEPVRSQTRPLAQLQQVPAAALADAPYQTPMLIVTVTPAEPVWTAPPVGERARYRSAVLELPIGYTVSGMEVIPQFGDNRRELARVDSLLQAIQGDSTLEIRHVSVCGYASPEGSYANNERLARGRSEGFKRYLEGRYPGSAPILHADVSWVPEDWEGLARLVEASRLSAKDAVLDVVCDSSLVPDAKNQLLQDIEPWSEVYRPLLNEFYPRLRRIELTVHYTEKES